MLKIHNLFDLTHTLSADYLSSFEYPWQALPGIKDMIVSIGRNLDKNEYTEVLPQVWIHKTAIISTSAFICSPCIIGAETEIRHCAFIRGSALIGNKCVVGNSVEIKNAIIFDGVQTPHYNYVGDSILGYKAHMGAGSITSNVKSDKSLITVNDGNEKIFTGFKKFGSAVADNVEIGCNAVLNPGTVIGRNTNIYPLSFVRGYVPSESIFKTGGVIIKKKSERG